MGILYINMPKTWIRIQFYFFSLPLVESMVLAWIFYIISNLLSIFPQLMDQGESLQERNCIFLCQFTIYNKTLRLTCKKILSKIVSCTIPCPDLVAALLSFCHIKVTLSHVFIWSPLRGLVLGKVGIMSILNSAALSHRTVVTNEAALLGQCDIPSKIYSRFNMLFYHKT